MSVCEVCGRTDDEEETSGGISMAILHVCDACREDRQTGGKAAAEGETK